MVHCVFIVFHQTAVAKKNADTCTHTYKYTNTNNIYIHTNVYVEAIELHDMADTLFHYYFMLHCVTRR